MILKGLVFNKILQLCVCCLDSSKYHPCVCWILLKQSRATHLKIGNPLYLDKGRRTQGAGDLGFMLCVTLNEAILV